MTIVATVFVATVLCLCISPDVLADGTGEVIGMSYWSYSPSGDYGMDVRYHDDGRIWFAVTDPDGNISGIRGAVAITISDMGGEVRKHLYPLKVMGQQWVDFGTPILPDGDYLVRVSDSSGTNIVESGLRVGGVGTITILDPGNGSEVSFDVPYGTLISSSGSTLTVSFVSDGTGYPLRSFTASVPQGSVFNGWSVNGENLQDDSGVTVSDDVSITYAYVRWVAPTPAPTPNVVEDVSDDSVTVGYDGDMMINPITIRSSDNAVTSDQSRIARGYAEKVSENGMDPQVMVITDGGSIKIPSDLLGAIVSYNGSLTVIIGEVTLSLDTIALGDIGYASDLEFVVTRMIADVPRIDEAVAYDICILRNGERITDAVSSPIQVSIEYMLENPQSELRVYHIDVDPYEGLDATYSDGSIHFGIRILGGYAIVHEDVIQHTPWIWCILAAIVSLCLMIIIQYVRKVR